MDRMTWYRAGRHEPRNPWAFQPRLEQLEERLPLGESLGLFLTALTGANLLPDRSSGPTEQYLLAPARTAAAADTAAWHRTGEVVPIQYATAEAPSSAFAAEPGDYDGIEAPAAETPAADQFAGPWDDTELDKGFAARPRRGARSVVRPADLTNRSGGAPAGGVGFFTGRAPGSGITVAFVPFAADLAHPRAPQAVLEGQTLMSAQAAAAPPLARTDARPQPEHVHDHAHDEEDHHGGQPAGPSGGKPGAPGPNHDNDAFVGILPPFDGTWDRWSVSHPSTHWIPWGGDWSLDYYAGSGTHVIFDMGDWYYGGVAFGQVIQIGPACRSGVIADGGWFAKVDVYTSAGDRLGWVVYAHLTGPFVSVGQWISPGQSLGQLSRWRYSSCYQVTGEGGVHVHLEVYNYTHYACYSNWGSGTYLERWWAVLGGLGDHFAYTHRVDCGW